MNITRGIVAKAQKVVLYGVEGIGKSTFAAQFPDPLFIDTEGSTSNMDVARLDKATSWTMLQQQIQFVKQNKPCKTLVIDTIDWAERVLIENMCAIERKKSIEDFGYGQGFTRLTEEVGRFLNLLQDVVDAGIHVVLTAHAQVRKFELPEESGAFDKYELKLGLKTSARTSSLVKEWADMVLFANYKIISQATDKNATKFKAHGGQRVIYATPRPTWDAKNRFGLPDEMPMDFSSIAHIFETTSTSTPISIPTPVEESPTVIDPAKIELAIEDPNNPFPKDGADINYDGIPQALIDLMKAENVIPSEIQSAVAKRGYYPADTPIANYGDNFINGVLIAAWSQVFEIIKEERITNGAF